MLRGDECKTQHALPDDGKRAQKRSEANGRYAIVTEKIINLLEKGVVPWRRPWTSTGLPRNVGSKKPYQGLNFFLLSASKYVSPFWLTMRQANQLGGYVRKGEESTVVVFWKIEDLKQSTEDRDTEKTKRRIAGDSCSDIFASSISNNANCRKRYSKSSRRSRRTSTIRSKRRGGSSLECQTRPRFSTPDRRRSTAALTDRITLPPRELFT